MNMSTILLYKIHHLIHNSNYINYYYGTIMSHPPCHCANVCAICEAARACGPDEDAAASVGVSCVPGAGERIHLFPQPSDNNSSIHQPSDGDRQCKLNRNRYCLYICVFFKTREIDYVTTNYMVSS